MWGLPLHGAESPGSRKASGTPCSSKLWAPRALLGLGGLEERQGPLLPDRPLASMEVLDWYYGGFPVSVEGPALDSTSLVELMVLTWVQE